VEWRRDIALVRKEVSRNQHRLWFPDPKNRGFWQSYPRATARSGRAMSRAAVAWSRMVAIGSDAWSSGQHGERFCVPARLAACADLKIQRKPDENDAGCGEPRHLPTPISPVLPSDHPSGKAGGEFRLRYRIRPLKP
jgi:hypothetical protein